MTKTQKEFVEEQNNNVTIKDLAKAINVIFDGPDAILQTEDGYTFLFQANKFDELF